MVNTIRTLVKMDGSLCLKNDVVLLFSSYKIAIPSVLSYIADCEVVCFVFSFILLISLLSFPNPFGFSKDCYCENIPNRSTVTGAPSVKRRVN